MGKGFAPHRVVTRSDGKIIRDERFENFADAEPVWRERCAGLQAGESVTLQHGARVIKEWPKGGGHSISALST